MGRPKFRACFSAFLAMALGIIYCQPAWAADVYDEQNHTVIEKVTPGDIPRLIKLLGDPDTTVRGKAKDFLGSFAERSVPSLVEALDKGPNRYEVLEVLAVIKDPAAIAPIFKYVDDKDADVREMSRQALIDIGEQSGPFLVGRLERSEKVEATTYMLTKVNRTDDLARELRKMLLNPDPKTRAASVYILGEWKDAGSSKDVEALLSDKDKNVREKAVAAYQKVTNDYDQRVLVLLLKDESAKIRVMAGDLLAIVKDADPALISGPLSYAAKNDKDGDVRASAISALGDQKVSEGIIIFIEALNDPDTNVQCSAMYGLGKLKDETAVPYIVRLIKERKLTYDCVISVACRALIEIGKPVELEPFYPYLSLEPNEHNLEVLLDLIKLSVTDTNRGQSIEAIEKFIENAPEGTQKMKFIAQEAIDSIRK